MLLMATLAACSQPSTGGARPVSPAPGSACAPAPDAGPRSAEAGALALDAGTISDAGSAADTERAARPAPRLVLHAGDSMVGGTGGLTTALEAKYKPLGSKFVRDWQVSVSIQTYARSKHFSELLAKYDPDLVILTLGANDMLVPFPQSLASFIQAIAKKVAPRECYWLTPIPWTKDIALIQVIKDNAAPCKVFDGSALKIQRAGDGIHPTDKGGAEWAAAFFRLYESAGEK